MEVTFSQSKSRWYWLPVLVLTCGFFAWTTETRIKRVEQVSALAKVSDVPNGPASNEEPSVRRTLIVPERNETSFHVLAQTQQMLTQHVWRLRSVDYDNAPPGRVVTTPSAYRWWLALLARTEGAITGQRPVECVERVAVWAEPALLGFFLIAGSVLIAREFGSVAAILFSVGVVTVFPFAAGFLPAVPDPHGFARLWALSGAMLVLAGIYRPQRAVGRFVSAGALTAIGLWFDVPSTVPVLGGLVLGALAAIGLIRRSPSEARQLPWRVWSLSGAVTILALYLLDYFPDLTGSWQLESIHPLYGVAWLGLGELLVRVGNLRQTNPATTRLRDLLFAVAALVAIAALPTALAWTGGRGYLARDLLSLRLNNLPGGIVAANLWSWVTRDGVTSQLLITLAPILLIVPAAWLLIRAHQRSEVRTLLVVALGPVVVAVVMAFQQLSAWHLVDGTVLALVIVSTTRDVKSSYPRISALCAGFMLLIATVSAVQLWPAASTSAPLTLTASEAEELIERDIAMWLRKHSDDDRPIVFAPPRQTLTLAYYGGLRGIGTFAPDNTAGFRAALMISGVKSMEEVQTLVQARHIRYLVIPSWDSFFEEFGRLYLAKEMGGRSSFLVGELRRWNLPLWLPHGLFDAADRRI